MTARARARARAILTGVAGIALALGAATGAYAAFAAVTHNSGNSISTGTVELSDNDGGGALFSMTSVARGASQTRCMTVTYSGGLPATIRHFATVSGSLAPSLTLKVTRGSGASFGGCSGFVADAADYVGAGPGVLFDGALSTYPSSYALGITDPQDAPGPAQPEVWTGSESHVYRYEAVVENSASEGTSATATLMWEARNQ